MASQAASKPERLDGIVHTTHCWGEAYRGTKALLIACGLAADGQFPGDPGRGKTSVTYDKRGIQTPHRIGIDREGSFQITRSGRAKFVVSVWVRDSESELRREAARKANNNLASLIARTTASARHPSPSLALDPGPDNARERMTSDQARFKQGEVAWYLRSEGDWAEVEIVDAYDIQRVSREDGSLLGDDGRRFEYQYGYAVRCLGKTPFFVPAHKLRDSNAAVRHVRLVV